VRRIDAAGRVSAPNTILKYRSRNVRKAVAAARRKKTIANLPKRTRTALGKQGAKMAKRKR